MGGEGEFVSGVRADVARDTTGDIATGMCHKIGVQTCPVPERSIGRGRYKGCLKKVCGFVRIFFVTVTSAFFLLETHFLVKYVLSKLSQ